MKNNTVTIISENQINQVLEAGQEDPSYFQSMIASWPEGQPELWTFLTEENTDLLLEQERAYLHFLAAVLVAVYEQEEGEKPELDPEQLSTEEDKAWEKLNDQKKGRFRDKLDVFFDVNPQEDLLAFIEDALLDEEEDVLSKEGREPIFTKLYALITSLF